MALTPNLTRAAIVAPGTQSVWTDETVYGGANPTRNQVAVWLTAYKVSETQVETALDVENFDPETDTEFRTTNGVDGWHRYYFVIVDNYDGADTYSLNDVVYYSSTGLFYKAILNSFSGIVPTNTTYWISVADPTSLIQNDGTANESGNLVFQVIDKIVDFATSICYIKAAAKHAKESCGTDACGCSSRLGKAFHKIRDLFAVLPINETTGQFIEGEKNARLAERWCDDCGCLTR